MCESVYIVLDSALRFARQALVSDGGLNNNVFLVYYSINAAMPQ